MKISRRILAFAMAGLMLLGTLGYIFTIIASAATVTMGDVGNTEFKGGYELKTDPTNKIKNGAKVTFEVTLEALNATSATAIDGGTVGMNTNKGAFAPANDKNLTLTRGTGNFFTVKLENIVYDSTSNKGKLAFDIKQGNSVIKTIVIDVSAVCDSAAPVLPDKPDGGGSGAGSGSIDTTYGDIVLRYTIQTVYNRGGGKVFDIANITSTSNSSIESSYTADIRMKITDPNGTAATVTGATAKLDIGSFTGGTVVLDESSIKDLGDKKGVQYYLDIKGVKYSGSGNALGIIISNAGQYYAEIAVAVSECTPYKVPTDPVKPDTDYGAMAVATPYVIVSKYGYGGGAVTAGDTFTLSMTFYNTSANIDVQNMMITVAMPDGLMLTSSSNTFYISDLLKESSVTKTVQVTVKADAKPQSHNINVSMKYQYIDHHTEARKDNSTEETISIPVTQVDRFQVTGVDLSNEINLNEEASVTVNFVNKGRSEVYNISASISGNINNPGQQQNLGNLASGTTGSADFYITGATEGEIKGEIKITYEDTNMQEKTVVMPFMTKVVDGAGGGGMMMGGMGGMMGGVMGGEEAPPEETKKPIWPVVAVGVVLVAIPVALIIRKKIVKKRSEAADATL